MLRSLPDTRRLNTRRGVAMLHSDIVFGIVRTRDVWSPVKVRAEQVDPHLVAGRLRDDIYGEFEFRAIAGTTHDDAAKLRGSLIDDDLLHGAKLTIGADRARAATDAHIDGVRVGSAHGIRVAIQGH